MFDDHELRFDEDAKETYRVFPRPRPAEIAARQLLPPAEDHAGMRIPPMWLDAGALDARPVLHGTVIGEYLTNSWGKVGLLTTAVTSGNGHLAVGVVQLVPTTWYRYLDIGPDQQHQR